MYIYDLCKIIYIYIYYIYIDHKYIYVCIYKMILMPLSATSRDPFENFWLRYKLSLLVEAESLSGSAPFLKRKMYSQVGLVIVVAGGGDGC